MGEALGSIRSLHQQLDEMLEWERHMLQQVGGLPAPSGDRAQVTDLQDQVRALALKIERQELTYSRLEDKTNNVLIQFELGTGEEVENKLNEMTAFWRNVTGAIAEHKLVF